METPLALWEPKLAGDWPVSTGYPFEAKKIYDIPNGSVRATGWVVCLYSNSNCQNVLLK